MIYEYEIDLVIGVTNTVQEIRVDTRHAQRRVRCEINSTLNEARDRDRHERFRRFKFKLRDFESTGKSKRKREVLVMAIRSSTIQSLTLFLF